MNGQRERRAVWFCFWLIIAVSTLELLLIWKSQN